MKPDSSPFPTDGVFLVIPAYREAEALPRVLAELVPLGVEVVVIDDGSSDGTYEAARAWPVHLLRHPINLGQGAALQTGIEYALSQGAEIVVTFDADGQHRPEDLSGLCDPIRAGEVEVVLGSRFLAPESSRSLPLSRRLLLCLATRFTRWTTHLPVTDTHNGFRAFSARVAGQLQLIQPRMAHASEILERIQALGLAIREVPVEIRYTDYSRAKGQSAFGAVEILFDLVFGRLR